MRKLFPLPLLGLGSAEVESFGSYLHRCAYEQGVFVGELLRFVYRVASDSGLKCAHHVELPNYFDVAEVIRCNGLAETLVHFFEQATSQSLVDGTLLRLGGALGRSAGVVSKGFRWCPECFRDDAVLGRPVYFRLIWHLQAITHCPLHRSPLIVVCSACGCNQRSYIKTRAIGICQACSQPLSVRGKRLRNQDLAYSWEARGADLLELLADLAREPSVVLSAQSVADSLSHLFDYYWKNNRETELYALQPRDKFLSLIYAQKPMSLTLARRFAARLGIPILALLNGSASSVTPLLDSRWGQTLPSEFQVVHKMPPRDHRQVLKRMRQLMENNPEPLSIAMARELDISIGYLEYRFPLLIKELAQKHEDFRKEQQLRKRQRAQSSALAFFVDDKYNDQNKSRKQAYRVLRIETGLPKFMLKNAIQSAYVTLMM